MKNASPKDVERACALVYEHYTGKCWHVSKCVYDTKGVSKGFSRCKKCFKVDTPDNPPLSTSLDAWWEIWDAMDTYKLKRHYNMLCSIFNHKALFGFNVDPLHHLEAALRAAGLYDTWKEGCE